MRRFLRAWGRALVLFLAASMLVGGTLAWKSLDQAARNDKIQRSGAAGKAAVELIKREKGTDAPIQGAEFFLFDDDGVQVAKRAFYTDENGKIVVKLEPGDYYFQETYPSFGYDFDLDGDGQPITRYPFTVKKAGEKVTVKAFNRRTTGTLTVTKEVEDHDLREPTGEQKDKLFAFHVTFSDGKSYPCQIDGRDVSGGGTFWLRHGQAAVFSGVPVGVRYTVTEERVEDWSTFAYGSHGTIVPEGQTAVFKNILHYPEPERPPVLVVTKRLAGNDPAEDRDREFRFKLTLNGETIEFTLKPGESKTFEDVKFGDLYSVTETDGDYILTTEKATGTIALERTEAVFTNTGKNRPLVTIHGEKTWNGDAELRPSSVPIRLWNGDIQVDEVTVTPNASGKWEYTFTAPKYDKDGNEIAYTVREGPVDGFAPSHPAGGGKYDILNTPVEPVDADPPIKIRKVAEGRNIPPGQQFRFILRALDGAPLPRTEEGVPVPGRPSELRYPMTVNGSGTGEIELGVITFTCPGTFVYTVREEKGNDSGWTYDETRYKITYEVEARNGKLEVRRTIIPDGVNEQPVFRNRYAAPVRPTSPPGGGDDDDDDDVRHTPKPKPTATAGASPSPTPTAGESTTTPTPAAAESGTPEPTPTAAETAVPDPETSPGGSPPPQGTGTPPPGVPKTGDNGELSMWFAVTVSGGVGILVCLGYLYWKKHHYVGKRLMKK